MHDRRCNPCTHRASKGSGKWSSSTAFAISCEASITADGYSHRRGGVCGVRREHGEERLWVGGGVCD